MGDSRRDTKLFYQGCGGDGPGWGYWKSGLFEGFGTIVGTPEESNLYRKQYIPPPFDSSGVAHLRLQLKSQTDTKASTS